MALLVLGLGLCIPSLKAQAKETRCHNRVTGMTGTLSYDSLCISPTLKVPREYRDTAYEQYMKTAMNAAANFNDFNTALINFQKAMQQVPPGSDAYREARRGYQAAWLAKQAQSHPTFDPYLIWLQVSGVYHDAS